MQTQSRRAVRDFFGMDRLLSERYDDLSRTTVVLVAVWAASIVVFGATDVLHDVGPFLALSILGIFAFFTGLNVWIAALVVGVIAVTRSGRRPLVRASLLVALLVAALVGVFVLSGWSLGAADDGAVDGYVAARGLAMWGVAVAAVLLSARVLRGEHAPAPADSDEVAPADRRYRRRIAGARLVVLVLVLGGLTGWLRYAGGPSVRVLNDSTDVVAAQLCPRQECAGAARRVAPGAIRRFRFSPGDGSGAPNALRLTSDGDLLGCIALPGGPDLPRQLLVPVSLATPDDC